MKTWDVYLGIAWVGVVEAATRDDALAKARKHYRHPGLAADVREQKSTSMPVCGFVKHFVR